jgi:hypothetical protein
MNSPYGSLSVHLVIPAGVIRNDEPREGIAEEDGDCGKNTD